MRALWLPSLTEKDGDAQQEPLKLALDRRIRTADIASKARMLSLKHATDGRRLVTRAGTAHSWPELQVCERNRCHACPFQTVSRGGLPVWATRMTGWLPSLKISIAMITTITTSTASATTTSGKVMMVVVNAKTITLETA